MENNTRIKIKEFIDQQKQLNGLEAFNSDVLNYSVEPSIAQTLEKKIQESSAFLQKINFIGVDQQKGQKVSLSSTHPISSTTDTSTGTPRASKNPLGMEAKDYLCEQMDSDAQLSYALLDSWRHLKDFQIKWRDIIVEQIARDRLMAGFNGIKRAKTSDLASNPLLQDVAVGWLQKIREEAPAQTMGLDYTDPKNPVAAPIKVGDAAEATYKNLDALVEDAISSLLSDIYQGDADLVVLSSRKLLANKYVGVLNAANTAQEKVASDLLLSNRNFATIPVIMPSFMPKNTLLITKLSNLSIYTQNGTHRRTILDEPKYNMYSDMNSVNLAYVVEDYQGVALIENIELV